MKKSLALFLSHASVRIAEDKPNGREEVAFARSITTDDYVVLRREGLYHSLIFIAGSRSVKGEVACIRLFSPFEALNDNLFDVHDREGADRARLGLGL